jgi:hypothetical protein
MGHLKELHLRRVGIQCMSQFLYISNGSKCKADFYGVSKLRSTGDLPKQETYSFDLSLNSTQLMQLQASPKKGKKATNVGSAPGVSSLRGGLRARWICPSL